MTTTDTPGMSRPGSTSRHHVSLADSVTAHNYHPLPVVLAPGRGAWVTDVDGRRYLAVRSRGLWAGIGLDPALITGREGPAWRHLASGAGKPAALTCLLAVTPC